MSKVSVIIPYFQREAGLLRRALSSVVAQALPAGTELEIIVVDDGSPVSSRLETDGLVLPDWARLVLVEQENQGVAKARNAALDRVGADSKYIALLDSDDTWHAGHLAIALKALEAGRDFFFCDTERPGDYQSSLRDTSLLMKNFLTDPARSNAEIIDIDKDELMGMNLRDFVTHPQGAVFRRPLVDGLRFDAAVKNAGEDYIFFTQLIYRARRICFSPRTAVTCGKGVNIYYGSFGWDDAGFLRRLLDELKSRLIVKATVPLSRADGLWLRSNIKSMRTDISFHLVRYCARHGGRLPVEFYELLKRDRYFPLWFPAYLLQSIPRLLMKTYKPR